MEAPTSAHRRLASAYLALADDPTPPASQRTVPRVVGVVAAMVVLALASPLAWASAMQGRPPADQPAATPAAAKGSLPGPDADDDA
jgi:hypothetical protein